MEVDLTSANFETEVLQSPLPVLVDFWAVWCGPCKAISPFVHELAEKFSGKLKVAKVNVDEAGDIAGQFSIMSIPTLLLFKNGQVMEKHTGAMDKRSLEMFVSKYI